MTRVPKLSPEASPRQSQVNFTPSPQQAAIFQWALRGKGSAIVEAVAGAGKTTTLVKLCEIIRHLNQTAAFCAFNKKIAQDITLKLEQADISKQTVTSGTFHAIGLKALTASIGRSTVDGRKVWTIMDRLATPVYLQTFVAQLVSLGKQHGANLPGQPYSVADWENLIDHFDLVDKINIPDSDEVAEGEARELGSYWTKKVMDESAAYTTEIDFDDMLYLPLLLGSHVPQFDWVLVDEAQDTNFVRRELTRRMLKPGGRLVAVGDHHQAIYGFTGASHDALALIGELFECKTLPLTVTYRCPRNVVAFAQQWVSHIQAHESAPAGEVRSISLSKFNELRPGPDSVILCRNTKPLVQMAFDLIRRKIPCHVEGREIGQGLLKLANKWKAVKTIQDLNERLTKYLADEHYRLTKRGQEQKAQDVQDKVMTLRVLMEELSPREPVYALTAVVNSLFKDTNGGRRETVTLSTIHKAKGREWPIVYLLDRANLMPSPFARQEWQKAQEINLMYVAVTRAQESLIEIVVPASKARTRLNN